MDRVWLINHTLVMSGCPWQCDCSCAAVKDNNRYGSVQFHIAQDTVLHGFGGYFYCLLYADIAFSMSCKLLLHLSSVELPLWMNSLFSLSGCRCQRANIKGPTSRDLVFETTVLVSRPLETKFCGLGLGSCGLGLERSVLAVFETDQ